MRAWHFLPADGRLRYDDGRRVQVGKTYRYKGSEPIELCKRGMHASIKARVALKYAPGPIVCRVECGGEVLHGDDKLVCTERRVLWMADATDTLRRFARLCALDVVHLWDSPEVVLRYLRTGDESLRDAASAAASYAARDAARDAASVAARVAARDAASVAARVAAWYAARNAASAAAWDAARTAAWDAARDARYAAESAAGAAARNAAGDARYAAESAAGAAARDAQERRLARMLRELGRQQLT